MVENKYIKLMLHCVGIDYERPYKRHGRLFYKPYRNYYSTVPDDVYWEIIELAGYAMCGKENNGYVTFSLTEKGFDFLGKMLGIEFKR